MPDKNIEEFYKAHFENYIEDTVYSQNRLEEFEDKFGNRSYYVSKMPGLTAGYPSISRVVFQESNIYVLLEGMKFTVANFIKILNSDSPMIQAMPTAATETADSYVINVFYPDNGFFHITADGYNNVSIFLRSLQVDKNHLEFLHHAIAVQQGKESNYTQSYEECSCIVKSTSSTINYDYQCHNRYNNGPCVISTKVLIAIVVKEYNFLKINDIS